MLLQADIVSIYAPFVASLSAIGALVTLLVSRRKMHVSVSTLAEEMSKEKQESSQSPSHFVSNEDVLEASETSKDELGHTELGRRIHDATKLFDEYGDEIRAVIRFNVKDESEADAVFQDCFLSMVRNPIPAGLPDVRKYLYWAVANDITDTSRRSKGSRDNTCKYSASKDYTMIRDDIRDLLASSAVEQKAWHLIAKRVPQADAEVVTRLYSHGVSIAETANKFHVDRRSVSRYLSIAIKRIRGFIKEQPPHE